MATVEYAALVVLVCAAVAVGAAVSRADGVASAVGAQVRRALCLVAGGDCLGRMGPRPCVVRSTGRARVAEASVAVLRLRDGRTVLREERSDGTVQVTVVQSNGAGAGFVLGGKLQIGGRGVDAGVEAGGGGDAAFGRSFTLPDGAAADRLIARLAEDDAAIGGALTGLVAFVRGRGAGEEDARFAELSGRAEIDAALGALGLRLHGSGFRDLAAGVRVDRDGTRTLALRLDHDVQAALTAPLARLGGGKDDATAVELAFGRDGLPAALTLRRTAGVRGDVRLGPFTAGRGDRVEAEARLDLADARLRSLVSRALHADLDAAREVAVRLGETARLDARLYATTRSEATRGATLALLGRLGVEVVTVTDTARLVAAAGREPGLGWSRRLDCLVAA